MAGPVTYGFRQIEKPDGRKETKPLDAGKNPPNGVIVAYYLAEKPEGEITLTILDEGGNQVRQFNSKKAKAEGEQAATESGTSTAAEVVAEAAEGSQVITEPEAEEVEQEQFIPKDQGINRFVWNFRYENATKIPGNKFSELTSAGPEVPPGTYQARLQIGDETFTESFEVLKDPRVDVSQEDLKAQFELGMQIRDTLSRLNESVIELRDVREQLEGWETRLARRDNTEDARKTARELKERLTGIEEELMNTKATGRFMYPPPNVPTRLNHKLAFLAGALGSADAAPTRQEY